VHEQKFLLPGGKCDSTDEGWIATLLRECEEESQVRVVRDSVAFLGHQVVIGKAAARAIPCTFVGKHLRFSDDDIAQIVAEGARPPVTRRRSTRR